jgi:Protein of unknown function (DUF4242)
MDSYVAECFWPGVTRADLELLDGRASLSAGRASGAEQPVRYIGSMLMPEDEVVFCFYEGPSADAIAGAARLAQIPFARIVASTGPPRGEDSRQRSPH